MNAVTKLQVLNIGNNEITSLPVLDGLTNLKTLYLFNNKLTSINGIFPKSKKLEFVSANNNNLKELPAEFADTKMKTLNFDNNNVTNLPEEYVNMTFISSVSMSRNLFDCKAIKEKFGSSAFAISCVQAQQKTEDEYPALPTSFSTDPPKEGLDGFEIAAIIFAFVFVIALVICIVLFVRYRNTGIDA